MKDEIRLEDSERQTCGRRMSDFGPWDRKENLDTWNRIGTDRVCSFCGSMHPDDLMKLVKEHGFSVLSGTDKGYKYYIERKHIQNASYGAIKYYTHHNTPEFVKEFNEFLDYSRAMNKWIIENERNGENI